MTFHDVNLAGLAAIRAIVQAVAAQPDTELSHADAAVTVAFALVFRLVAHPADSGFHFVPNISDTASLNKMDLPCICPTGTPSGAPAAISNAAAVRRLGSSG